MAHLEGRRPAHALDDDSLRIMASRAISGAVAALEELAAMSAGRIRSSALGPGMSEVTDYPDLAAAKALLDAGIRIKKLLVSSIFRYKILSLIC